jgi:hypothetical protein
METSDYTATAAHQWRLDRDLSGMLGWRCLRCGSFRVTQPVLGEQSCVIMPGGAEGGGSVEMPGTPAGP